MFRTWRPAVTRYGVCHRMFDRRTCPVRRTAGLPSLPHSARRPSLDSQAASCRGPDNGPAPTPFVAAATLYSCSRLPHGCWRDPSRHTHEIRHAGDRPDWHLEHHSVFRLPARGVQGKPHTSPFCSLARSATTGRGLVIPIHSMNGCCLRTTLDAGATQVTKR